MAEPKTVVAPLEAVNQPPPAVVASEAAAPKVVVKFWKTMNPFEKIVFADKTQLVFGQSTFATADPAVIKNLLSVATRYGIIQQS